MSRFLAPLVMAACLFSTLQPSEAQMTCGIAKDDPSGMLVEYTVETPQVENIEQTFKVMVPFQENGTTQMREETRTRRIAVTKMASSVRLVKPSPENHSFFDLAGNKLSFEEFQNKAKAILMLAPHQEITELHRQVLKESVLVMKLAPRQSESKK